MKGTLQMSEVSLFADITSTIGQRRPPLGGIHQSIIQQSAKTSSTLTQWGVEPIANRRGWKRELQVPKSIEDLVGQLCAMKNGDTIALVSQEIAGQWYSTAANLPRTVVASLFDLIIDREFVLVGDEVGTVQRIEKYECRM
jgi:hypothetical protein